MVSYTVKGLGYTILPLVFVTVTGCTTMPHTKVIGVDDYKPVIHIVEAGQIWTHCKDALTPTQRLTLSLPMACAWLHFDTRECHVFITDKTPQATLDHELLHCKGYDHGGNLQRGYDNWKASKPQVAR